MDAIIEEFLRAANSGNLETLIVCVEIVAASGGNMEGPLAYEGLVVVAGREMEATTTNLVDINESTLGKNLEAMVKHVVDTTEVVLPTNEAIQMENVVDEVADIEVLSSGEKKEALEASIFSILSNIVRLATTTKTTTCKVSEN